MSKANVGSAELLANFPRNIYPHILPNERTALEIIGRENRSVLLEAPTGSGKTVIGYTFLRAILRDGGRMLFFIVPTKTLVEQVQSFFPDVIVAFGRNEHPCLFYQGQFRADDVPCSLLDCPHRVDQETGMTAQRGAEPCPYLLQKWQAKQGGRIVVCTASFYLFTRLFSQEFERPDGLVIDEVHKLARIVRGSLSFEITDYHLNCSIRLLRNIGAEAEADGLERFLRSMIRAIRSRRRARSTLLEPDELRRLIGILETIDEHQMTRHVASALRERRVDAVEHREVLRRTEIIIRDLRRYIASLGYALPTDERDPLSYVYSFFEREQVEGSRVQYRLYIKSYYVAPVIRRILSPMTLGMSATIGDPNILGFETGIRAPFHSLTSDFPADNTRIFMPGDTPNLAHNVRSRQQPTRVLRQVAKACRRFARKGRRSLVVVVSNRELEKFLFVAREEGVNVVTYGNGSQPREAAARFKAGEGDVLAGTAANYGEGVDLPEGMAPVIFFLRPGYPSPTDPATIFEERRFGSMRWALWNWRVMIEALQVRGRNVRGISDRGVTFFISQQFRRFVYASLPEWLRPSYKGDQTFEQCIGEAERLLVG